jgi:hypothetical protein
LAIVYDGYGRVREFVGVSSRHSDIRPLLDGAWPLPWSSPAFARHHHRLGELQCPQYHVKLLPVPRPRQHHYDRNVVESVSTRGRRDRPETLQISLDLPYSTNSKASVTGIAGRRARRWRTVPLDARS